MWSSVPKSVKLISTNENTSFDLKNSSKSKPSLHCSQERWDGFTFHSSHWVLFLLGFGVCCFKNKSALVSVIFVSSVAF